MENVSKKKAGRVHEKDKKVVMQPNSFRPHYAQEIRLEIKKWMVILERYGGGGILDNSDGESEDNTSSDEQTQQGKDGPRDAEDGDDGDEGETQHDIVENSTSYKNDS
ncbi:hypothetical protein ACFX1W_040694 [Malus domestica]